MKNFICFLCFLVLSPSILWAEMVVSPPIEDGPPPTCTLVLQDFTTYTENDVYNEISNVTATSFDYFGASNNTAYLRKEFTGGEFNEDFTIKWFWVKDSAGAQDFAVAEAMVLSKNTNDVFQTQSTGDLIRVDTRLVAPDNQIKLVLNENGVANVAIWPNASDDETYHLKLTRDDNGGDNGTGLYTLVIRLDDSSGAIQETLSLSAGAGEGGNNWLYHYAFDSFKNGNFYASGGTISNYSVGPCIE